MQCKLREFELHYAQSGKIAFNVHGYLNQNSMHMRSKRFFLKYFLARKNTSFVGQKLISNQFQSKYLKEEDEEATKSKHATNETTLQRGNKQRKNKNTSLFYVK